ncbi:MAG: sensor histidine kinase [bacterium]
MNIRSQTSWMKPKNQSPARRSKKPLTRNPPPQSRLSSSRQEKPLESVALKKRYVALIAAGIFGLVFWLTGLEGVLAPEGLSAKGVAGLDAARQEVSSLLRRGVRPDSLEFQKLLQQPFPGLHSLSFVPQQESEVLELASEVIAVPVSSRSIQGILIAKPQWSFWQHWPLRLLLSAGAGLFVLALWLQLRARQVTHLVDKLCRQFVRFRREQESEEMDLERRTMPRSDLELRVEVLQELWERFQSMQGELAANVRELEQSKRKLEDTVEDLHKAQQQERRLVELGYAVAEFGHDIGNANGSIMSFTSLLLQMLSKEEVTALERARALTFIRRVSQSSVNIKGLTEDILEFAAGRLAIKEEVFDFEDFESQLNTQLGFVDSVPVDYCIPPHQVNMQFRVDGRKLIRVIVNLVKNAWEKLREVEGGQIEIRFIPSGADLIIQVVDNGSPIPEQILENLFQPFQTQGKEGGTGLGLSISRKMVELHGGSIEVRNLPQNAGVLFQVVLPERILTASAPEALALSS